MKLLLVNGVNLNMLGRRDPVHYGAMTLPELEQTVCRYAEDRGFCVECFSTQYEGALVEKLQQTDADAVLLNPGAFSHYSYALRDCVECIAPPVVEVHLSDILHREPFRANRVLADVVAGFFCGKKEKSYFEGVDFLSELLQKNTQK